MSVGDVIAHLFYLQDLLSIKDIARVFWTPCLEIQFYLFFGVAIVLFQQSSVSGRPFGNRKREAPLIEGSAGRARAEVNGILVHGAVLSNQGAVDSSAESA